MFQSTLTRILEQIGSMIPYSSLQLSALTSSLKTLTSFFCSTRSAFISLLAVSHQENSELLTYNTAGGLAEKKTGSGYQNPEIVRRLIHNVNLGYDCSRSYHLTAASLRTVIGEIRTRRHRSISGHISSRSDTRIAIELKRHGLPGIW